MIKKLLFTALLSPILFTEASEMGIAKYLYRLESNNIVCYAELDKLYVFDNKESKEPVSMGINITAFLENGRNTLMMSIAAIDFKNDKQAYDPDSRCEVRITKETPEASTEYVKMIGTVDEDLKPTGKYSPDYKNETYILNQKEYYALPDEPETSYYRIDREFIVSGLPEWAWTKAEKFEATEENIAKLRAAYTKLWTLFKNKDEAGIKKMAEISFSEKEKAHGIETPGYWYDSLDFTQNFENYAGMMPINWADYKVKTYKDGRLVHLINPNTSQSPIRFMKSDGSGGASYNPYFSLMDGEIVLTR